MKTVLAHIARFDWLLMGAVLLLIAMGLVSLFSLSGTSAFPFFKRQLAWAGVGIVLLVSVSKVDFRIFKTQSAVVLLLYTISLLLLGIALAGEKIRGVSAWISVGNFFFQPVEIVKVFLAVLLAKFFSKRHIEIYRIQHLAVSAGYVAIPAFLVLLQPDLGSAIILGGIWVAVVLFSGMHVKHFFALLCIGILISGLAWNFLFHSYQKERITAFLDPYQDPKGAGYQMIQAMIAVGSGRVFGKGVGYGSQSHLNFLPEAETDFIFASFAEEWGFLGVLALYSLFLILFWRIIRIGSISADNFSRLYCLGFAAFVFLQSFIHMGMNMGVLPITGITLPFVSYGGSSLVALMVGVGIVQSIKINSSPAHSQEDTVLV